MVRNGIIYICRGGGSGRSRATPRGMNARKGRGGSIGLVRNTRRDAHHDRLGASNELRHGPRGGEVFATLRALPRSWPQVQ